MKPLLHSQKETQAQRKEIRPRGGLGLDRCLDEGLAMGTLQGAWVWTAWN